VSVGVVVSLDVVKLSKPTALRTPEVCRWPITRASLVKRPQHPISFRACPAGLRFFTNLDIASNEHFGALTCWSDGLSVCWRYVSGLGPGEFAEGRP
jgi:hypothetical protein